MRTLKTAAAILAAVLTMASVAEAAPDAVCVENMKAQAASNRAMAATVSDVVFWKVRDEASAAYQASDEDRKDKIMQFALAVTAAVAAVTEKPTSEFVNEMAILQAAASLRQLDQLATVRRNSGMGYVGQDVQLAAINGLIDGIVLAALTSCEPLP